MLLWQHEQVTLQHGEKFRQNEVVPILTVNKTKWKLHRETKCFKYDIKHGLKAKLSMK